MALAILDRVLNRRRERQEAIIHDYNSLVVALADNLQPDEAVVDGVLANAGKSTNDLAAAVQRLLRRRQLAELIKGESAACIAVGTADQEIAALDRERETYLQQWAQRRAAVAAKLAAAEATLGRIRSAREQLVATSPELGNQIGNLRLRAKRLDDEAADIRRRDKNSAQNALHTARENLAVRLGLRSKPNLPQAAVPGREPPALAQPTPAQISADRDCREAAERVAAFERLAAEREKQAAELRRQADALEPLQFQP